MSLTQSYEIFDQFEYINTNPEQEAQAIGNTVLAISQLTIDFASVERIPRYFHNRRENDAEHSFMLGLTSMEIGKQYYPGLDAGLMVQFSLVHDLVELETLDTPTFQADEATLAAKHDAEQAALEKLSRTLPPHIADMLIWYEEQEQTEARLVRHIDKLLPYAVNTTGAGVAVMNEDYGVTSVPQMMAKNDILEARFNLMFPDRVHQILHGTHTVLAKRFALELGA